jgi:hypothetical protein
MHFQYILKSHKIYRQNKIRSFLLVSICLLTILGLVIICYDDNLLDNNYPPVIAFQSTIFIYHSDDEIALMKIIKESITLFLTNISTFLTRSPPV